MCKSFLRQLFLGSSGKERPSPGNWISLTQEERRVLEGQLTVAFKRSIKIFGIADTNSMDGLLDIGHNVIATDTFQREKLIVGDIVIYQAGGPLIVHRIVKITEDSYGRIYRTQGDNNIEIDRHPLRDINIKYLVLGILY